MTLQLGAMFKTMFNYTMQGLFRPVVMKTRHLKGMEAYAKTTFYFTKLKVQEVSGFECKTAKENWNQSKNNTFDKVGCVS